VTTESLVLPPVAGVSIVHERAAPVEFFEPQVPDWPGSRGIRAALRVRHVVGDVSTNGLHAVLDIPPWSTYLADASGAASVLFHEQRGRRPAHLLVPVRAGYDYEVRYAALPEESISHRGTDLAVFALGLASRGDGVVAHSVGFLLPGGPAVLCPGISGAGKSTLARLVADVPGVTVLSDDRTVLTLEGGAPWLWGTPWPGDAGIACAADARLGAIVFLRHGRETRVADVRAGEAVRRLLSTLALPLWHFGEMEDALALLERVVLAVPAIEVWYPPTPAAARWIIDAVSDRIAHG
jgi:hypothetical protein